MRNTTLYIDENIIKLLKSKGINISKEVNLYLSKMAEVYKDTDSKDSLEDELSKLIAKSEAIKNRIKELDKPVKKDKDEPTESELTI